MFVSELVIGGYLLNYLPYFLTDRTLFLHHYLPAVIFKILAFAVIIDHIYKFYNRYDIKHRKKKKSCENNFLNFNSVL